MWKGEGWAWGTVEQRRRGQKSCTQRPKGQALHLGSRWLVGSVPIGKPSWKGQAYEGDCVLWAWLWAGALDWELGTQLDTLCRALCSFRSTSLHSSETLLGEHHKPHFIDALVEAQE